MRRIISCGLLAALLSIGSAEAVTMRFCMQPSAPIAYLRKPARPYCASSRTCSDHEVSSYRLEVETYYRRLRQYATDLDNFYNEASEYVGCMAELD